MSIPDIYGSLKKGKSVPFENNKHVNGVVNTDLTFDKSLLEKDYIKRTYYNRQAMNIDRFNDVVKRLQQYISGYHITVMYMHKLNSDSNIQTDVTDLPDKHSVDKSFLQINNFELTLSEPLTFAYDDENQTSVLTGTAIVYPGFNPVMGDLFIYDIDEHFTGLFRINDTPNRLTIKTNASHEINFKLEEFIDEKRMEELKRMVRNVAWFDKERFLTGDCALLEADEIIILKDIEKVVPVLSKYYIDTFYDTITHRTFIREDGIYDPYIVDFILDTPIINYLEVRPLQLLSFIQYKNNSLWRKLKNIDSMPLENVMNYVTIKIKHMSALDTLVNSLLNREYLEFLPMPTNKLISTKENEDLSKYMDLHIFDNDKQHYNNMDYLLEEFLVKRSISIDKLFEFINKYLELTVKETFYYIPIFIYILEVIKESIKTGKHDMKYVMSSSIDNFKEEINKFIPLKKTAILISNFSYISEFIEESNVILPEDHSLGEYLEITNPTAFDLIVSSNKNTVSQQIVGYSEQSNISNNEEIRLGVLKKDNSHVRLKAISKNPHVWEVISHDGFTIIRD